MVVLDLPCRSLAASVIWRAYRDIANSGVSQHNRLTAIYFFHSAANGGPEKAWFNFIELSPAKALLKVIEVIELSA